MMLSKLRQQLWTQLHFPFHVALILLLEGSQIIALALDSTLKLSHLKDTISMVCSSELLPTSTEALGLLRDRVADLSIDFDPGTEGEKDAISSILDELGQGPLCPNHGTDYYTLDQSRADNLMGNVTAALFNSRGIVPEHKKESMTEMTYQEVLREHLKMLEFVYVYYMLIGAAIMFFFAAFTMITRRHRVKRLHEAIGIAARLLLGILMASLVSFTQHGDHGSLARSFMQSPSILYLLTFMLLPGMSHLFNDVFVWIVCILTSRACSALVRSASGPSGDLRW